MSIVEAIADARGVAPDELDVPIQEYIETEAVELLAAHENASWTLSFEVLDHDVTVTSDGSVLVDGVREEVWV